MKFTAMVFGVGFASIGVAQEMPIFDAHIHYSHDAVIAVPPTEAVKILRQAGVVNALISSSDDDGTQKLYEAAPVGRDTDPVGGAETAETVARGALAHGPGQDLFAVEPRDGDEGFSVVGGQQ